MPLSLRVQCDAASTSGRAAPPWQRSRQPPVQARLQNPWQRQATKKVHYVRDFLHPDDAKAVLKECNRLK